MRCPASPPFPSSDGSSIWLLCGMVPDRVFRKTVERSPPGMPLKRDGRNTGSAFRSGMYFRFPVAGPHAPELFKETNMIQISKRIKQREQLALALLQQPSMEKAAAAVGISTTTAWRIGKTPEFEEQFERARRNAYDQVSSRLQYGAAKAVDILVDVMENPRAPHACKVRAADTMLHHATKAKEMDVDARLGRLERTPVTETQP